MVTLQRPLSRGHSGEDFGAQRDEARRDESCHAQDPARTANTIASIAYEHRGARRPEDVPENEHESL